MRIFTVSIGLLLCVTSAAVSAKPGSIRYVNVRHIGAHVVIVDTRAQALCEQRSIEGAHCLPASDFVGPSGKLPGFADIFWALGTAGLDGSETVLVVGNRAVARDFISGILYLCGQANIEILKSPINKVLQTGRFRSGYGKPRAVLRQRIYQATMRDAAMILPGELKSLQRHNLHIRYLDVDQMKRDVPLTPEMNKKGRHKIEYREWQVIYGRSVRNAIAWFTRLVARHDTVNKRIRVVPVAVVAGLHNNASRVAL